jgi:hypothetical protein
MAAGDHDIGPGLGEAAGHCLTQPLVATRDQRNPAREIKQVRGHSCSRLIIF